MRKSTRMLLAGFCLFSGTALADAEVIYRAAPGAFDSMPVPSGTTSGTGGLGALLGHDGISAATLNDTVDLFVFDPTATPLDFGPGKEFDLIGTIAKTKARRLLVSLDGSIHMIRSNNYGGTDAKDMALTLAGHPEYLPALLRFPNIETVGGRHFLKPTTSVPDGEGLYTYSIMPTVDPLYANESIVAEPEPCADGQAAIGIFLWEEHLNLDAKLVFTTSDSRISKSFQLPIQKHDTVYRTSNCPAPRG